MSELTPLLHALLSAPPPVPTSTSFVDFWRERARAPALTPFDRALLWGVRAPGLGLAFAAGYQAALRQLFGELAEGDVLSALCVTEAGGGHPRQLQTRLDARGDRLHLQGTKSFVTLGSDAGRLFVVAHQGLRSDGRPDLAVVMLDAPGPGIDLDPLPPLPFVPEIGHAAVHLDVELEPRARLAGDGYTRYVKPFRTVEDIHVFAALLAHIAGVMRRLDAPILVERCLSVLLGLRALAGEDPGSAATHIALAGLLEAARGVFDEATEHEGLSSEKRKRYNRDRQLFSIAASARKKRLLRAWESVT